MSNLFPDNLFKAEFDSIYNNPLPAHQRMLHHSHIKQAYAAIYPFGSNMRYKPFAVDRITLDIFL